MNNTDTKELLHFPLALISIGFEFVFRVLRWDEIQIWESQSFSTWFKTANNHGTMLILREIVRVGMRRFDIHCRVFPG